MWLCPYVRLFRLFVSFVKKIFCLNDQAYNCLIYFYIKYISKITFDGRRPFMEDDFNGRRHLMEDDLRWKTTFNGRQT